MVRDTAPIIALSALNKNKSDLSLPILPEDHFIASQVSSIDAVLKAVLLAETAKLGPIGIVFSKPNTGYEYIEVVESLDGYSADSIEGKSDSETVVGHLIHGGYCRSSGKFLFRASRQLKELKVHRPDIATACKEAMGIWDRTWISSVYILVGTPQ